jgi:bifunctional non-homologous end joining protein LigD
MAELNFPMVGIGCQSRIVWIGSVTDGNALFDQVKASEGEGIVAKRKNSVWTEGKRTTNWLKVKRHYVGTFIVTGYDESNGYVHVGILIKGQLQPIGLFSHGLDGKDRDALVQILKNNSLAKNGHRIEVAPRICVDLTFLELYQLQLRHPRFLRFRLDQDWEECTWEALQKQMEN